MLLTYLLIALNILHKLRPYSNCKLIDSIEVLKIYRKGCLVSTVYCMYAHFDGYVHS